MLVEQATHVSLPGKGCMSTHSVAANLKLVFHFTSRLAASMACRCSVRPVLAQRMH